MNEKQTAGGAVALSDQANWHPRWAIQRYENNHAVAAMQNLTDQAVQKAQASPLFMHNVKARLAALVLEKQRYLALIRAGLSDLDWGTIKAQLAFYLSPEGAVAVARALLPVSQRLDIAYGVAYSVDEFQDNGLANTGINELWSLVAGTGGVLFDNTNGFLGTGTDNTAFSASQTDLLGAGVRVGQEGGYPTYGTSQKATWQSSFGGGVANQVWAEFATFNHTSAGDMLNRKVEAEGTKTAGQTWVLTLDITLS